MSQVNRERLIHYSNTISWGEALSVAFATGVLRENIPLVNIYSLSECICPMTEEITMLVYESEVDRQARISEYRDWKSRTKVDDYRKERSSYNGESEYGQNNEAVTYGMLGRWKGVGVYF